MSVLQVTQFYASCSEGRPDHGSDAVGSNVQQQELPLPRADNLHERFELPPFQTGIKTNELMAKHPLQFRLSLQQRNRFQQTTV